MLFSRFSFKNLSLLPLVVAVITSLPMMSQAAESCAELFEPLEIGLLQNMASRVHGIVRLQQLLPGNRKFKMVTETPRGSIVESLSVRYDRIDAAVEISIDRKPFVSMRAVPVHTEHASTNEKLIGLTPNTKTYIRDNHLIISESSTISAGTRKTHILQTIEFDLGAIGHVDGSHVVKGTIHRNKSVTSNFANEAPTNESYPFTIFVDAR